MNVYITEKGEKYHIYKSCIKKYNTIEITEEEAKKKGKQLCKNCFVRFQDNKYNKKYYKYNKYNNNNKKPNFINKHDPDDIIYNNTLMRNQESTSEDILSENNNNSKNINNNVMKRKKKKK